MSERGCTFAAVFENGKNKMTQLLTLQLAFFFTPLGVVLSILALVGIVAFFVACWRNIKRK
jgi:hypothetical protein